MMLNDTNSSLLSALEDNPRKTPIFQCNSTEEQTDICSKTSLVQAGNNSFVASFNATLCPFSAPSRLCSIATVSIYLVQDQLRVIDTKVEASPWLCSDAFLAVNQRSLDGIAISSNTSNSLNVTTTSAPKNSTAQLSNTSAPGPFNSGFNDSAGPLSNSSILIANQTVPVVSNPIPEAKNETTMQGADRNVTQGSGQMASDARTPASFNKVPQIPTRAHSLVTRGHPRSRSTL